jgi:hypothetical protein
VVESRNFINLKDRNTSCVSWSDHGGIESREGVGGGEVCLYAVESKKTKVEGNNCYPKIEVIGVSSRLRFSSKVAVLTRMFPILDLRWEENAVRRKWKSPRSCYAT